MGDGQLRVPKHIWLRSGKPMLWASVPLAANPPSDSYWPASFPAYRSVRPGVSLCQRTRPVPRARPTRRPARFRRRWPPGRRSFAALPRPTPVPLQRLECAVLGRVDVDGDAGAVDAHEAPVVNALGDGRHWIGRRVRVHATRVRSVWFARVWVRWPGRRRHPHLTGRRSPRTAERRRLARGCPPGRLPPACCRGERTPVPSDGSTAGRPRWRRGSPSTGC